MNLGFILMPIRSHPNDRKLRLFWGHFLQKFGGFGRSVGSIWFTELGIYELCWNLGEFGLGECDINESDLSVIRTYVFYIVPRIRLLGRILLCCIASMLRSTCSFLSYPIIIIIILLYIYLNYRNYFSFILLFNEVKLL